MSPAMSEVAVAVVSWNTRELLDACLRSLEPPARSGLAEVFVVDNASSDGSAEMVRARHAWAHLIEQPENVGFGAAANRVAAVTRAPWIAVANADTELVDSALEALLAAGSSHARAGAIAPRLVLPDGSTQHSVHALPSLTQALVFNLGLGRALPRLGDRLLIEGAWNPDRSRRVDWAVAAFLLIRRAAWDAVQGFDEQHWMYAEDLDFGWRLSQAGWGTWYEASAVVRHARAAATTQAWGEERTERSLWSTYSWILRRRGMPFTRAYAAVNVVGARARAGLLALSARRDPARFAPRRERLLWWAQLHRIGLRGREELERHR